MRRDGAYQEEVTAHTARDDLTYLSDPLRGEAEDHARGVRSGGHLEDHAPAPSWLTWPELSPVAMGRPVDDELRRAA